MAIFLPTAEKKTFAGITGSVPRGRNRPSRIVIHTTETNVLPGYNSGKAAPHFTIGVGHPGSLAREPLGVVRVWQHISLDRTARALKREGSLETNHMGTHCVQIECVTYVGDQEPHGIKGNQGKFPLPLTEALAGLVREIVSTLGDININEFPTLWSATNSAGSDAKQRLTSTEWEQFNGICGHQHVPNNTHWDPGAFDIRAFVNLVNSSSEGSGARSTNGAVTALDTWPLLFEEGDRDDKVEMIRGALQTLGYGDFTPGDLYNRKVENAVRELQKTEKITVDGIWGPETHSHATARLEAALMR